MLLEVIPCFEKECCLYFVNFDVTLFFNFMLMLMLGKEMFPNNYDVLWLCIFCNNYS